MIYNIEQALREALLPALLGGEEVNDRMILLLGQNQMIWTGNTSTQGVDGTEIWHLGIQMWVHFGLPPWREITKLRWAQGLREEGQCGIEEVAGSGGDDHNVVDEG